MASTPELPSDFADLLAAFADADVRYLVIGGYAVGFHDRPRATKDLDILLDGDETNIERTCGALVAFGAAPSTIEAVRTSSHDDIVWFGAPPVRVDLLKSAPGIEFDAAFQRRAEMHVGELAVPVVSLEDLIAMKTAADRDQDRVDVRRLERRRQTSK
ncbi:MAG TPA: nucleotidyl transferase AbiEii/AbiGii toxin family protein [Polyangiaceae bacterium]|nr:nucleotidyl transferase AbiEii/AbiGii toxin family protein [Polyangiaceae bacterium]